MSKLPSVSLSGTYFFKPNEFSFLTIYFPAFLCQIKTDLSYQIFHAFFFNLPSY
jgi:hypothetical protein